MNALKGTLHFFFSRYRSNFNMAAVYLVHRDVENLNLFIFFLIFLR